MTPPSPYDPAIQSLLERDFKFKVRKDLRTGRVEGLEIDYAPIMRDTGIAKVKEIVSDLFSVEWMGNGETNEYILIKLK